MSKIVDAKPLSDSEKSTRKEFIIGTKFELINMHKLRFASNPKRGLYGYDNGVYKEDPEAGRLKKFISDIRANIDNPTNNEIVEEIKTDAFKEFEEFDKNTNLVPLLNCNYNLDTDKIEEFNPEIISTSRIPIKYDPTADCPTIKAFLKQVVAPDDIPVVEELFGFLLSKRYEHKYMFVFHGGRDSGKSTLLELMETFIDGNASHVPPHTIALDKFAAAELLDKRANISGDISAKMLGDTNLLKMLIGNDNMYADKKFGNIFSFRSFAKQIFACNTLPAIPDNDFDIFVEKIKVISVPNTIPKDKQDHTLLGRMTTPQELSGLFNLALEGRKRLKKQNDFSNPLTKEQMMERYFAAADPVVKFVRDIVDLSVTEVTLKDDVTKAFTDYCKMKKLSYPKTPSSFWRTFKSALPKDVIDYNRQVGSKPKKYAIGGIRLRNLSEIEIEENTITAPVIPKEITTIPVTPIENIDYGYDQAMPQPEPETLTQAEIDEQNYYWEIQKAIRDAEEERDEKALAEYKKQFPEPEIPETE